MRAQCLSRDASAPWAGARVQLCRSPLGISRARHRSRSHRRSHLGCLCGISLRHSPAALRRSRSRSEPRAPEDSSQRMRMVGVIGRVEGNEPSWAAVDYNAHRPSLCSGLESRAPLMPKSNTKRSASHELSFSLSLWFVACATLTRPSPRMAGGIGVLSSSAW